MTDATAGSAAAPTKSGKKPLMIGAALALLLGGGGFYATWSGLLLSGDAPVVPEAAAPAQEGGLTGDSGGDVAFLSLEPVVISLAPGASARHLRFRAELEVPSGALGDVAHLQPRIVDVINSYLRAVEPSELTRPGALIRLRAQLLRRLELVVGPEQIEDLLIMEFVLD